MDQINNSGGNLANPRLSELANNMKWVGYGYIVMGVISCLSIIGAITGIPMLISGLRAKDSAEKLDEYIASDNPGSYELFFNDLAQHFKMIKIYFIITIILTLIGILGYILFFSVFLAAIMGNMQQAGSV